MSFADWTKKTIPQKHPIALPKEHVSQERKQITETINLTTLNVDDHIHYYRERTQSIRYGRFVRIEPLFEGSCVAYWGDTPQEAELQRFQTTIPLNLVRHGWPDASEIIRRAPVD